MTVAGQSRLALQRRLPPGQLRRLLERLGPTFVKVGQYLALRPDILDQSYCDELLALVDRVAPVPWPDIRRLLTNELGDDPAIVFAGITTQPSGSGSIAQVHEARTHDGAEVAVKVRRPGIVAQVERDLSRVRWLARLIERAGLSPGVRAIDIVAELQRWMAEELDFEHELANLSWMHRAALRSTVMRLPRPYPKLCSPVVITAEYLPGVPFSVILRHIRDGEPARVVALGFDPKVLAERLIEAVLEQIFQIRIFHADMHPGNLLALPEGRVGFIDFGLVETLEPTLESGISRCLRAIYFNDPDELISALDEFMVPGDRADPEAFRLDFLEENRRWLRERQVGGPNASSLSRYMIGVLHAARRHDMRFSSGVLAIYRSLLAAETVAHELDPDVDVGLIGQRFFRRLQLDQMLRLQDPDLLREELFETLEILRSAPRKLDRLLSDVTSNRVRLRTEQTTSPADRRLRSHQVRLLVAAQGLVAVTVLLAGTRGIMLFGDQPLASLLWCLLAANIIWLAILWRRLP
jgi:ubiquinone biosynthesis protein